ncbi:MAG: hypothetical protein ACRCZ0_12060 [Cetobacterium sp.]
MDIRFELAEIDNRLKELKKLMKYEQKDLEEFGFSVSDIETEMDMLIEDKSELSKLFKKHINKKKGKNIIE